jgi:hypothetical protein
MQSRGNAWVLVRPVLISNYRDLSTEQLKNRGAGELG